MPTTKIKFIQFYNNQNELYLLSIFIRISKYRMFIKKLSPNFFILRNNFLFQKLGNNSITELLIKMDPAV